MMKYLLFCIAFCWSMSALAQTEAAAAGNDLQLQSRRENRSVVVKPGEEVEFKLKQESKYRKSQTYTTVVDSNVYFSKDTVSVGALEYLSVGNSKTYKTGRGLVIGALISLPVALVFLGVMIIAALAGLPLLWLAILSAIVSYGIIALFIPIMIIGLVLLMTSRRTYNLVRDWKIKLNAG